MINLRADDITARDAVHVCNFTYEMGEGKKESDRSMG